MGLYLNCVLEQHLSISVFCFYFINHTFIWLLNFYHSYPTHMCINTIIYFISRGGTKTVKGGQFQQPYWFLGEPIWLLFCFQGGLLGGGGGGIQYDMQQEDSTVVKECLARPLPFPNASHFSESPGIGAGMVVATSAWKVHCTKMAIQEYK